MLKPKYDFDDVVRLKTDVVELPHLAGMYGVVTGISETDEMSDEIQYGVWFYGFDEIYACSESELLPTLYRDNVSRRWWGDSTVRVGVDADSGEGVIIEVNIET